MIFEYFADMKSDLMFMVVVYVRGWNNEYWYHDTGNGWWVKL